MKKIAAAMISIGVLMAFVACSWEVPQTVSVKSKADYSFSLGNFEQELNDEMDITSMLGDLEANPVITPYDYFPGKKDKNTQHFLLEIQVFDQDLAGSGRITGSIPATGTVDVGSLGFDGVSAGIIGLDFNPSTILTGMKEALGGDMEGKIAFAEVPMYLYCETVPGITAKATMRMFYGNKADSITEINGTNKSVLQNSSISNTPRPAYETDGESGPIITDLATTNTIGGESLDIRDIINIESSNVTEEDQLCVECSITEISGTVSAASVQNGIPLKLYAVIDIPLKFDVCEEMAMDLSSMSGDNAELTNSEGEVVDTSSSAGDSEFAKYLDVVDKIAIKYIAYRLPFYATSGMKLGIDMVGNGSYEYSKLSVVNKNKNITESDKSSISLPYTTMEKIKSNATFNPNIQILMMKNSAFSIPREKAVEINVELNLVTDGVVQVM